MLTYDSVLLSQYSSEDETDELDAQLQGLRNKKKELAVVDHNKIYYRPYRKDFYKEIPELQKMTVERKWLNYWSLLESYCILAWWCHVA